jgi:hypothetical protein
VLVNPVGDGLGFLDITVIPFTVTREREMWFHLLQNTTVKILLTVKRDALRDF